MMAQMPVCVHMCVLCLFAVTFLPGSICTVLFDMQSFH
jgi:hypothetical protein